MQCIRSELIRIGMKFELVFDVTFWCFSLVVNIFPLSSSIALVVLVSIAVADES